MSMSVSPVLKSISQIQLKVVPEIPGDHYNWNEAQECKIQNFLCNSGENEDKVQ